MIKAELEVLKKVGTWAVMDRLRGWNIVVCKWVLHIKKDVARKIERYKAQLVAKVFTQVYGMDYSCSTSTAPSLTGNLMTMKKYSWSNCLAMKNLTHRNIASSCTCQSMDLNELDANGMRLYVTHSQTWDLRSARLTQLSSIFTPARIF